MQRDPLAGLPLQPRTLHGYSYALNNPTSATDPSGLFTPDVAVDLAFIAYDVGRLLAENVFGSNQKTLQTNLRALGADLVGAALPVATGLGLGVRAADTLGGVAAPIARAVADACSFSADTPVQTADGPRPIASLRVGELVLAYDERSGIVGLYPITAVFSHDEEHVLKLTIDGEVLTATPEHPFYTLEHGWLPAEALRAGLHVRKSDGGFGIVHALALEQQPQRMYNLSVAEAHTFYVGEGQWLVHNTCPGGEALSAAARAFLTSGPADTHVYYGVRQGQSVYVGITNNLDRRRAEHAARFALDPITTTPVTRGQARAIEQAIISNNRGLENIRNSIIPIRSAHAV